MIEPLPTPVATAITAANSGDSDGFLGVFMSDGFVNDWGRIFSGRGGIRGWSDREFIGANVWLDVLAAENAGHTTTVQAEVGGDGFTGPSTFTFVCSGELLQSMRISA